MFDRIELPQEFSIDMDELAEFRPMSSRRDHHAQLVDTIRGNFKRYYQDKSPTGKMYEEYAECEEALMSMSRMTHFQVGKRSNE